MSFLPDDPAQDNRAKLVVITDRDFLWLLRWRQHEHLHLPAFKGLPDDAWVDAVNYDPACRAFLVRVVHPSFEPVPFGQRLPEIAVEMNYVKVAVDASSDEPEARFRMPGPLRATAPSLPPAPAPAKKSWEFLGPPLRS